MRNGSAAQHEKAMAIAPVVRRLSRGGVAVLRAVADDRAEMAPLCCDQTLARELARADLIHPACAGRFDQWVRAVLTLADSHTVTRTRATASVDRLRN